MQRAGLSLRLSLTLFAMCALGAAVLVTYRLRSVAGDAQTTAATAPVQGDFLGALVLGPGAILHLKLHIHAAADGTLSGALDSVDQGAIGIPCSDFRVEGGKFSFAVPRVNGTWTGTIENGGATLAGIWTQGSSVPLTFSRDILVTAARPAAVDGFWLGTLHSGAQAMRMQIVVKSDAAGREFCAVDNLDLRFFGVPCANVVFSGAAFSFDVPAALSRWSGTLSNDGRSLTGAWSQQGTAQQPLDLERQAAAIPAPPTPPPRRASYDSAIAPVDAASMQTVLDRDLAQAIKSGALSPETSSGVAVGVMRNGVLRVFAYGTAKPDSIFEIGSITKTFTGLVLAQLVVQRKVRLDEPVRELLPPGTAAKPSGAEITLLDLVTQHSGLPRMPDNFHPADPDNPYVDYHAANLYEFVRAHGLEKPAKTGFLYSNLGVGLLGQALANRADTSYAALVAQEVTKPLGVSDTVISLSPNQESRFIQGHTADHRPAHAWDIDALAGAGGLRSTASDMLTYLEANLHPERIAGKSGNGATLPMALMLSHRLRADAGPGMRIAFAWLYRTDTGTYWHNGGTGGYTAYAFFNPAGNYAGVVLMNTTLGARGDFADLLGEHIDERFAGQRAVSLAN